MPWSCVPLFSLRSMRSVSLLAELVELADLDRRAERARFEIEAQPLVAIVGVGLEVADDEQVDQRSGIA